jgi:hypothetical protein
MRHFPKHSDRLLPHESVLEHYVSTNRNKSGIMRLRLLRTKQRYTSVNGFYTWKMYRESHKLHLRISGDAHHVFERERKDRKRKAHG